MGGLTCFVLLCFTLVESQRQMQRTGASRGLQCQRQSRSEAALALGPTTVRTPRTAKRAPHLREKRSQRKKKGGLSACSPQVCHHLPQLFLRSSEIIGCLGRALGGKQALLPKLLEGIPALPWVHLEAALEKRSLFVLDESQIRER